MNIKLIKEIQQLNPWLDKAVDTVVLGDGYIPRLQEKRLVMPDWDKLVTVLVGPRQAGKTTLGKHLCQQLLREKRYEQLIYLTCDSQLIRQWLVNAQIINELIEEFQLKNFILFIDEVQRLETPGLLIKLLIDLGMPFKLMVSGSSQLELRSKLQEFLTGRQLEATILPLSYLELGKPVDLCPYLIYGCYPQIVQQREKQPLLSELYKQYINRDIVEILQLGKPAVVEKMMTLLAHSSGQLLNYQTLASDCHVSVSVINNYMDVLEQTYVIKRVKPFVGNKRAEITSNPKCYYLDNGFRNQALGNFAGIENRTDGGLLVESAVFQEIYKFKVQHFMDYNVHYWRTKNGAEVDFVIRVNDEKIYPIEVKYQNFSKPTVSRSFRSFLDAYNPVKAMIVTKEFDEVITINETQVHFVPLRKLHRFFEWLS